MSAEGNRGAPVAAAALRRSVEAQIAQLTEDPQSAVVRPWVRTELERGVLGVSRFTQYGTEYEFRSDEALDRGGEASAPSPMRYLRCPLSALLKRAIPLYVKITLRGVVISDDRPPPLHNEENEEQTR